MSGTSYIEMPTTAVARLNGGGWGRSLSPDQLVLVRRMLTDQVDPFINIRLPKKRGSFRPISAPTDEWMAVLRMLQQQFLSDPRIASDSAFAYVTGRSAADCARVHLNSEWVARVDIKDFYHSIGEDRIYFAAKNYGLDARAARFLSRIVTRRPKSPLPPWAPKYSQRERFLRHLPTPTKKSRRGFLPQGSPTSGAVSNMVTYELDAELDSLTRQHGWRYSRYADDLFVGSPVVGVDAKRSGRSRESDEAVLALHGALVRHGFHPHPDKTRVMRRGRRQAVLGLLVDGHALRPTREKVRHVEFHLYALDRFSDWDAHARIHGFTDVLALLRHLGGHLSYFHNANPELASRLSHRLSQAVENWQRRESVSHGGKRED